MANLTIRSSESVVQHAAQKITEHCDQQLKILAACIQSENVILKTTSRELQRAANISVVTSSIVLIITSLWLYYIIQSDNLGRHITFFNLGMSLLIIKVNKESMRNREKQFSVVEGLREKIIKLKAESDFYQKFQGEFLERAARIFSTKYASDVRINKQLLQSLNA